MLPVILSYMLILSLVEAQHAGGIAHPGSYMALFPAYIDKADFSIYFKLLRPVAYETIEVRLLYSNYSDSGEKNVTKATGSLSLSSGTKEGTITLKVPDELSSYGKYDVFIRGRGILNFENVTSVNLGWRRYSEKEKDYIFIQTDKAVYKTGQKAMDAAIIENIPEMESAETGIPQIVWFIKINNTPLPRAKHKKALRYRVFVLDKDMKPRDPVMNIDIQDPKNNKIKEHVNVSGVFGISGELQLSEQPPLGEWKIRVNLRDTKNTEEMRFLVNEYVLPKFEVKVNLPDFGTVANPELKGTVTAKYTYGKPVKGHVTLRVTKSSSYWWFYAPKAIQTEFEIDGEAGFSIATDTLLKFDPSLKYDTLVVEANVTEEETGEVRLAQSTVAFHERPLQLQFLTYGEDVFKPGFKYTTYLKVTQPDGRPLTPSGDRVRISVTYFTDKQAPSALSFRPPNSPSSNLMEFISPFPDGDVLFMPEMFLSVPRDGMIKLELDIPTNVATGHIEVNLRDEKTSKNIQRFRTASKSYLHLEMKSSFVKVGKQAEFSVRSNVRPNGKVTYHIIKNREIIDTHYTHIASVYQKNTFFVTMTSEMVPECTLLAYYYNDQHSEIIADAIKFSVDMSFQNDVNLRFDRTKVSPGTNVSLNVRADPGSQVFVLAVDKSVILHKTGNDITERKVYNRLGIVERPSWKYSDSYLYQRVSANDPIGIFNSIGLAVMTDASLYDFDFWTLKRQMEGQSSAAGSGYPYGSSSMSLDTNECLGPGCSNMYAKTYISAHPTVRKDFPETWMWTNESVRQIEAASRKSDMFVVDVDEVMPPGPCSADSPNSCYCTGPHCEMDLSESLPGTGIIRKDFPETWIWSNESVSSSGNVVMTATVPDTITDWVATGFALNANSGLGVAPVPANVTAYLPFFVSLHLPFSIVSGEVAVIQALVFNYYPHDMYVTVSLKNSSDEFLGVTVNRYGQEEETKDRVQKCILVKSNDAESAYFTIKAQIIGTINLEVEASSPRGKDTVRRQLIVRPPGQQEEDNIPVLLSLENGGNFQQDIPIAYPLRIVPDSQRIQITVIGDIFGPSLDHLDQLIKIPYGCGEQNMVRFAPAVFAARYLKVTNRYSDKMKKEVEHIMETGYQRQLTYQRYDGSFSAFGWRDREGSLWLTAFVLKSFAQASEFTYIDPDIVERGVRFILGNQNKDGSFNTTGFVHNTRMQGGSVSSSKSLAAYVLIALKEVQDKEIMKNASEIQTLRSAISSVWSFVQQNSPRLTDEYEMAISAYAASQMTRGGATDLLNRLDRSGTKVDSDGAKHWRNAVKSLEIETAGYVLLAHANENDINAALPVMKWLIQQRSPYGGFISTQDTVVALQGLSDIASQMYSSDVSMTVQVDYGSDTPKNVSINAENMDVLQFIDVPEDVRTLRLTAEGRGTGLVEISIFYNVLEEERNPSFDLMVTTNGTEVERFTLKACARWLGIEDSGMVLLDIGFPSGYKPLVNEELPWQPQFPDVSRWERDHGRLVLYYDNLDEEVKCITVDVVRESTIGRSQPASVKVYSYYDIEKSAMKFYLPNTLKKNYICDFCGVECGCGFDPEAVPMERCTGLVSNYRTATRTAVYPGFTDKSSRTAAVYPGFTDKPIYQGSSNKVIYPAVLDSEIHRVIEPLHQESMRTIRQRLQPNRWHRGQTIPVTFSRTTKLGESFPVMTNSFPTISRKWTVTRT